MATKVGVRIVLKHSASVVLFTALAIVWTYPLVNGFSQRVLGWSADDNLTFLWNIWWMREALASPESFFQTKYLFAPIGVDLTLHTHTALPAFIGATLLRSFDEIQALNITILAAIALAGVTTYGLAWHLTGRHLASAVAGLIYAGSPYMAGHLHGHFNLIHVWVLPLFAWAVVKGFATRSWGWQALAGATLGLTLYVDYYLAVYQIVMLVCFLFMDTASVAVARRPATLTSRAVLAAALAGIGMTVCVMIAIVLTGGFDVPLFGRTISTHTTFNPRQALWLCVALAAVAALRPRLSFAWRPGAARALATTMAAVGVPALLIAAPLVWKGVVLVSTGQYVSQAYFWRSAPKGVDSITLALGNQFGSVGRPVIEWLYGRAGIEGVDESAWLGVVPMGLAVFAITRFRSQTSVRQWTAMGSVFMLWALGPHLMFFGANTGMILPQAMVRFIPIISNARMPGRAMAVVYLALALLSAMAIANLRMGARYRALGAAVALMGGIVLDYLPAPFPSIALQRPAIYEVLRDRPETGTLMELPLGIRDGFGEHGFLDHRVLFYQTIHRRPLTGGFAARLSPSVLQFYLTDPLLGPLLRMSGDEAAPTTAAPDRAASRELLNHHGIRFIMLNRAIASPELVEYVQQTLPVQRLMDSDSGRTLFIVP